MYVCVLSWTCSVSVSASMLINLYSVKGGTQNVHCYNHFWPPVCLKTIYCRIVINYRLSD